MIIPFKNNFKKSLKVSVKSRKEMIVINVHALEKNLIALIRNLVDSTNISVRKWMNHSKILVKITK